MTENAIFVNYNKFPNLGVYRANFPNLREPRAPSQNCKKIPVFSLNGTSAYGTLVKIYIYKIFTYLTPVRSSLVGRFDMVTQCLHFDESCLAQIARVFQTKMFISLVVSEVLQMSIPRIATLAFERFQLSMALKMLFKNWSNVITFIANFTIELEYLLMLQNM